MASDLLCKSSVEDKTMKKFLILLLIIPMMQGCIWIDDDDDDEHWQHNDEERIMYINRTDCEVENFIDGRYVGTVRAWDTMNEYGHEYDGTHTFRSSATDCDAEWGPDEFNIHDGETFRIYLEDGYMRIMRE